MAKADGDDTLVDFPDPTFTDVDGTVELLRGSKEVIIVPGYDLAVANGQYRPEILKRCTRRG